MGSRIKTQQVPAVIRGFVPPQVSTLLESSFVARDEMEKLKPGKGIRNDFPVAEAEGSGLEKRFKIAGKVSSSEWLILKQRRVGNRSHGATKVLQKTLSETRPQS